MGSTGNKMDSLACADFVNGEVLLVDKPLNWTSFDVVGKIRNTLKPLKLKVGHAGTLDPLATGLLIVCTGKRTKTIDQLQAEEKEYTGTLVLGATTPSYDLETPIDARFETEHITPALLQATAKQFIGQITQYAPDHSAIKIDGERSYEKARRGETIEKKSRQVTIRTFEINSSQFPEVRFRVICSKGTYIRSLVHDFGRALNSGAHLTGLRRTRSGAHQIEQAWDLSELIQGIRLLKPRFQEIVNNQK